MPEVSYSSGTPAKPRGVNGSGNGPTYPTSPPTLYEPGDSDGPLSGPGNGYIPLWARPHQQPDGTINNPDDDPTGDPQDSTDQVEARPERDNDPPPF